MNSELVSKYHAELARLDGELAHYERQWTKVPQFAWAALLAPVVGIMWGFVAALVELLVTAVLVGVRAYLIAMRRSEVSWNRARLVQDLENARARAATPRTSASAVRVLAS